MRRILLLVTAVIALATATACNTASETGQTTQSDLSGTIKIDGSSTVFPISEAVAEEFQKDNQRVQVTVGQSGTGGGFEKFCNGETDISDASRPIKDEEAAACKKKNIAFAELKVAIDGLSVVVNPKNTFTECMTVAELKKAWEPNSTVKTWRDIRPAWPANPIKFYGAGSDSGTFDYFTDEIVGKEGAIRSDYTGSEDDNILVRGVAGDANAIGFFGYAYYAQNKDKVKTIAIDNGSGCVEPTEDSIESGKYAPLSRPLYVYPSNAALKRPEVSAFVKFYLDNVNDLLADVGYIAVPDADLQTSTQNLDKALGS